jgi:Tol biopolymer transport system component
LVAAALLAATVTIISQNFAAIFGGNISSAIETTGNAEIAKEVKFGVTPGLEGKILYTAYTGKQKMLLSSLANGSEYPQVMVADEAISAAWSPTGDRIVYQRFDAATTDIFAVNEAGGNSIQLTGMNIDQHASTPSWFPTGQLIFYESNISGKYEIYHTQPADQKTSFQRVTVTTKEGENVAPSISPDGRHLIFSHGAGSEWDIYMLELGKTDKWTQLTNAPGSDEYPVWSPNGKQIAFSSHRDGHAEIYIMNADGSDQQRLTTTAEDKWSRVPAWSPDGHYIAFVSNQSNSFAQLYGDIFVVDVRNRALRQLTFSGKIWTWRISWAQN